MSKTPNSIAVKHIKNIFRSRVDKWKSGKIDDDKMWKSIKHYCNKYKIENVDECMSLEEATKYITEYFNRLELSYL